MTSAIHLLVPAPFSVISGGYIYDRRMVEGLRPVFLWDRLYIGGGNSRHITPTALATLGEDVVIVPNSAALIGGARVWNLQTD